MRADEDLLLAAAAGDGAAFGEFYARHVAAITTFVKRRAGSPEAAFDLAAETFAAAAAGLDSFERERGSARGWLFTIAANEVRQAQRRGRVENAARLRLSLEPVVLDDPAIARIEEIVDDGLLTRVLESLPAAEREAIEARVLDEQDYADLAVALACSESVVRQRVSRGLRKIRIAAEEAQ